jgi:hypothetical protein
MDYIKKHPDKLVVYAYTVSLLFIIVGHVYRDQIQAKFKQSFFTVKSFDVDYWSFTHVALFMFIGFVKPDHALTFFVLGVLFEIFEDGMASDEGTQSIDCKGVKKSISQKIMCNGVEDSYWYGKIDDIAFNLIGYTIGQAIRKTYFV